MSKLLIGLLSALVSTNQLEAASNLVESAGVSAEISNPQDPVEKEYKKLLEEDDESQREVDKWILESRSSTNAPSASTLNLRINQRFDPIKKHYEDFLQRNPRHARARLAYGSFLNDIRDEDGAVAQWEKARKIDPRNPAAWNNLANYYGHRSPVKKAFEYYAKAIELDPTEPVYYQNFATTVYLFRKDAMEFYKIDEAQVFDKALDLYREAMKLAPNDFVLATDYAQSFYGTKPPRYKDALVAWTDVFKIAGDEIERDGIRIHLGRVNWKLGNYEEARRQLNIVTNELYLPSKDKLLRNIAESEKQSNSTNNEKVE